MSKILKSGTNDSEDVPFFEKTLYKVEVKEDEELDKTVITVPAQNIEEGTYVHYRITGGNVGGVFRVEPETGAIYLNKHLDYETVRQYELRLTVSDENGALSSTSVIVTVVDTNDNPPVFQRAVYSTTVTEEDAKGLPKRILEVNVTDGDTARPGNIVYYLSGPGVDSDDTSNSKFSINKYTGEIFILKPLDRDFPNGRAQWKFTVFAQDEGGEGLVGYAEVQVNLKDVNDNAPVFLQRLQTANVTENSTAGLVVVTMVATDQDDPLEGRNALLTYNIEKNVLDEQTGTSIFTIEPHSGLIRTNICCLDREKTPEYTLQVVAVDGGGLKGTGTVSILVSDINDMSPSFTKDEWMTEVLETMEDRLPDYAILTVNVIDPDETNDFYYKVVEGTGPGTDRFTMVRNADSTGSLKVIKPLDYEDPLQRNGFRFKIQGPNGTDDEDHVAYSWVVVRLRDLNDNSPRFDKRSSTVSLQEDVTLATVVDTFRARDPDQGGGGRVTFSIDRATDRGRHFNISDDGVVTVQRALDRETDSLHKIVIKAEDGGDPPLISSATLTVNVLDVNDNAPVFFEDYCPVLQENKAPKAVVELYARDVDDHAKGNGPPYTFSLDPTAGHGIAELFSVETNPKGDTNHGTAVVSSLVTFDREKQKEYHIPIVIQDSGDPMMVGTSTLTVVIGDVNDNGIGPGTTDILVYRLEGTPVPVDIGRVYVEDLDDWDLPDKLFIWEGDPVGGISLDRDTGTLELTEELAAGSYSMQVKVRDSRHGPGSVTSAVTVTVRTISHLDMSHAAKITILDITDSQFIKKTNNSSQLEMFRETVSQLLNTSLENVQVFSVQSDTSTPPHTDVRFFVKQNSKYLDPVKLHGLLLINRHLVENATGKKLSYVGTSGCLTTSKCETDPGCTTTESPTPNLQLVDGNNTQLAGPRWPGGDGVTCVCGAREFSRDYNCQTLPCYHGGTCLDTKHGPRCICPKYHEGPRCQQTTRGFRGEGWSWYPPLQACSPSHLSLDVLTAKSEGLILYNGPVGPPSLSTPLRSDFISVEIVEGQARVLLDLGSGTVDLTSPVKLDDGEWHRIDVLWDFEMARLVVDLCRPWNTTTVRTNQCEVTITLPLTSSFLTVNTPLQLGGWYVQTFNPDEYHWSQTPYGVPLDGCIKNVMFNSQIVDLALPAMSQDSTPGCPHTRHICQAACSPRSVCDASLTVALCNCPPGYFGSDCSTPTVPSAFIQDSYVKYTLRVEPDPFSTRLQLKFRTREPKGEMFRLVDQHQRYYFILEITDSRVQVRMNLNGPRSKEEVITLSHVNVADGTWHFVKVSRHGSAVTLLLDGAEGRLYNASIRFVGRQELFIDKQEGVYAGGTSGLLGLRPDLISTSFSQGCLDDIRLDGRPLPLPPTQNGSQWAQVPISRGVERQCTSKNVCVDVKCPTNLTCQDIWNDYMCACPGGSLPAEDGRCEYKDDCSPSPCGYGGVCSPLYHGPGPGYRCDCPDGVWGSRCEIATERQSLRVGLGALFTVVGCLLLILVLVALFLAYHKRRDAPNIKKPQNDCDIRENIISYNVEGGGEDDLNAFDLLPLKVPVLGPDDGRLQVPELIEETSLESRIEGRRRRTELAHTAPPYDDLRNYAYEGSCESVLGSLSSLESCVDAEENVRFVVLGPRFTRLANIYSTHTNDPSIEATEV